MRVPQRGAQPTRVSYPRFLGALIIVGLPAVLIIVQPDLGIGSVLIAMAMGVLLVAGAKARYILTISLAVGGHASARRSSAGLVNDYQLARVRVFFDENNPDLQKERVPGRQRRARPSAPAASSARAG